MKEPMRRAVAPLLFVLAWGMVQCLMSGCALAQWRIWQRKVPGAQSEKPPEQLEGERQGAAFIRARTTPPVTDPAAVLAEIHPVAEALSASLGEPKTAPAAGDNKDATIAALRAGLLAKDRQLDSWRAFGRKYGDMPIEGTGINLAGPTGLLGLVLVVAACFFFPPLGYLVVRVIPVLWGALRGSAGAIERFASALPAEGQVLDTHLAALHSEPQAKLFASLRKALSLNPSTPGPAS